MTADHTRALQQLYSYYECDTDSEICHIPYSEHHKWQKYLSVWIRAGLISISREYPERMSCSGCGEMRSIEFQNDKPLYRCFGCRNICQLSHEEIILYEIGLNNIARFLRDNLQITGQQEEILTDRVIKLGKRQFEAGKFVCFLLRGITACWEDAEKIINKCQPMDTTAGSLLFILGSVSSVIETKRMVVIALADTLRDDDNIQLNLEEIENVLMFAYKGCTAGKLRELNEIQFGKWLKEEIRTKRILPGEKATAIEHAKQQFGIGRDRAQVIWNKTASGKYIAGGRRQKAS